MKKLFSLIILVLVLTKGFAVTDFVCKCNSSTGEDYDTISEWFTAMVTYVTDLRSATVKVLSHSGITGAISDGDSVTGEDSSATGTAVHVTATQILIVVATGTFQDAEQIYETLDTNYVTTTSAPDEVALLLNCYNDQGSGIISDAINITGMALDVDNDLTVTAPVGERHDGITTGGGFEVQQSTSDGNMFSINTDFVTVSFLKLKSASTIKNSCSSISTSFDDNDCTFQSILIYGSRSCYGGTSGIYVRGQRTKVYGCIVYTGGDIGLYVHAESYNSQIYNNTIYSLSTRATASAIGGQAGAICKNNVFMSASSGVSCADFYAGVGSEYNASDDESADDDADASNSILNINPALEFIDYTAGDLLIDGATAVSILDINNDLGTEGNIDIVGRDRNAEGDDWDIGADEYQSAVTFKPYIIMY